MFGFLEREEGVAVRHRGIALTYGDLNSLILKVRAGLRSLEVEAGDRVAHLLPNSIELLVSFYACILEGLVMVPISDRLTDREIHKILDHSQPRALVTMPGSEARLSRWGSRGSVPISTLDKIHEWLEPEEGKEQDSLPPASVPPPEYTGWPMDHPAILFYTSGSTGTPKGALYTHGTLIDNERIFRVGWDITADDHSVVCHCMASNFMFSQATVPFLHAGGTVEVVEMGNVGQMRTAIEAGATFLSLIPWFGLELIEAARKDAVVPNRIRVCQVAGDKVPMSFHTGIKEVFGFLPREHLGMTETNSFTASPQEETVVRLGCVGMPIPETEVEIRDPGRRPVPEGEDGEIWVKTPGRMREYWEAPELTADTIVDDWVATGDAGHLDENGFLWLSGRIKNIIISDGENVYPGEIEDGIADHPLVKQVCVFGVPHEWRGEVPAAAVVLENPEDTFRLEDLQAHISHRFSEVKTPKALLVLPELPETPRGKVDRKALVQALNWGNGEC